MVDELHVNAGSLFRGGSKVVEVIRVIGVLTRPGSEDLGHVKPGDEITGEGVEEAFFRLVDLGDAENVVDVSEDCVAFVGDEISGCVTGWGLLVYGMGRDLKWGTYCQSRRCGC